MPDRIIRDEILESDRWLWLPNDTDRLVYIGLLLKCDDFGNLEGGQRRMFRLLHAFTQIKTEEATATALIHLLDADLIRRYEVQGRELFHLPRFKAGRDYLVRRVPESPWDPKEWQLGKHKRLITRGLAKNLSKDLGHVPKQLDDVSPGVGVGVGVGVGKILKSTTLSSSQKAANLDAIELLEFLNSKTERNFRPTSANLDLLKARIKEGYSVRDIRIVIVRKCRDWKGDDKMEKYLRPMTLFNRTKFAQYVGEVPPQESADVPQLPRM